MVSGNATRATRTRPLARSMRRIYLATLRPDAPSLTVDHALKVKTAPTPSGPRRRVSIAAQQFPMLDPKTDMQGILPHPRGRRSMWRRVLIRNFVVMTTAAGPYWNGVH